MASYRIPKPVAHALNDLVKESVVFLRHEIKSQLVLVKFNLARDLPRVEVDKTLLQQIVVNLMVNTIQAKTEGDCTIRDVFISAQKGGAHVTLMFRDISGISPRYDTHFRR